MTELLLRVETRPDRPTLGVASAAATDLRAGRYKSFDLVVHAARAAEVAGFDGVVLPFDPEGEHPLITAVAVARATSRIRVIPEVPTSLASPVYAAKLSTTFARTFGPRLGWRISSRSLGPAYGDLLEGADREERDREFLEIARRVAAETTVDVEGRFFTVRGGGLQAPLGGHPFPEVQSVGIDLPDARPVTTTPTAGALLEVPVVARQTREELPVAPQGAIVGTYPEVAHLLRGLGSDGVAGFVLQLTPTIEEAYRFGQFVRPLLAEEDIRVA